MGLAIEATETTVARARYLLSLARRGQARRRDALARLWYGGVPTSLTPADVQR